ncbi:MAG: response regulator transcription factor [Deltaproteobacteria bacterium]|nr:response regulator transcription factor [Deltaproteobacteria bacterium]MBW2069771.1 response regulator transcription factor [Deltaproteobacteria bacterium]
MSSLKPIRIFLADDHPLFRIGLRLSLGQYEHIEVIGEASDGFSAVERIQSDPPDISLIDADMPGFSGILAIKVLRQALPDAKILVLSTYRDEAYIRDAMRAGANGYVSKSVEVQELVRIITSLCKGEAVISPYLMNLTVSSLPQQQANGATDLPPLTLRETEILRAVSEGKGNKEISSSFNISIETVKSHIKSIYRKLEVKNRVEALMVARQQGLLD